MKLGMMMLFVKDVPKMSAFYREALELTPVEDFPNWVRFETGGAMLALHPVPPDVAARITIAAPPVVRSETAFKFTFYTDDIARACAQVVAHGGVQLFEPRSIGARVLADMADPEGNVFQLAG